MKLTLLILLFFPLFSQGKHYRLFYKDLNSSTGLMESYPVHNYSSNVESLREGDSVSFSDGREYRLGKLLGAGLSTRIFAINETQAIRITKTRMFRLVTPYTSRERVRDLLLSSKHYFEAYFTLEKYNVPRTKIYLEDTIPGEYILVKRESILFGLTDFLKKNSKYSNANISKTEEDIWNDFYAFALTTAAFIKISDCHTDQIVYTEKDG